MSYIYKITNNINGKIYIGKTMRSIKQRWKEHLANIKKEECKNRPLYRAINKYGVENFSIEKIEECSDIILSDREKYWIEYYNSFKNGYNATKGGDGSPYIDRKLVIETYKQIQNCKKTAEILNIHIDSVYKILKSNNIERKSSQEISKECSSKPVYMLNKKDLRILKVFASMKEAAKYIQEQTNNNTDLRGMASHIREVCQGKRKTAYGYNWKFLNYE